jgi:hypothetical protein
VLEILEILEITGSLVAPDPRHLLAVRMASLEEQSRRLLDALANFSLPH